MNDLGKLAAFSANLRLADVPSQAVAAAQLCVLDTVGVAIGAARSELVEAVIAGYKAIGEVEPQVAVWGRAEKLPLLRAAYSNAMMGHVLELDDVHTRSKTHIGTVVIPAAWAWAEHLGCTGSAFIEAVLCGYEVMSRIGMGFGVSSHRNRGWHVTCTAGTFGAAAASAKLLGLTPEQTWHALGLAGTQSSGLWAFLENGATCKVLHPARAAVNGMEAAILAKAGMTGPTHILEAEDGGLFAATSDEYDYTQVSAGLGERWEVLSLDKKPYPCCRSTHCTIDAALQLKQRHGLDGHEVEKVVVKTYLVGYKQCACTESSLNPVLPSDAKFSTPFTVACALLDGGVGLSHFLPEAIGRADVRELLGKVEVVADEAFTAKYPGNWGCELVLTTKDGNTYSCTVPDASGSVTSPMDKAGVEAKVRSVAEAVLGEGLDEVMQAVYHVNEAGKMPAL